MKSDFEDGIVLITEDAEGLQITTDLSIWGMHSMEMKQMNTGRQKPKGNMLK